MPDDVILLANDILALLKIQLTIQSEPLPSFATTLSNPDILISGCISENMDTTHLRGKRVQTSRGPVVQDLPPLNKKRKGATNSSYSAVEAGETDYASYCATSLTLSEATRICDAHKISRDTLAPAPNALEEQFLSESFDVELSCAKPVVWMLIQILCRYHLAFSYTGHTIGHYDRLPYEPIFVGPPPPRTKPRTHSQADKGVLQAETETMLRLGRWERTDDAVYASEAVVVAVHPEVYTSGWTATEPIVGL
ncbi:hypothetical protein HDU90_008940 [Geranomyces variabilis]|nr:hypothetical protein HDU90_008940 [Geranomyces variabilis]